MRASGRLLFPFPLRATNSRIFDWPNIFRTHFNTPRAGPLGGKWCGPRAEIIVSKSLRKWSVFAIHRKQFPVRQSSVSQFPQSVPHSEDACGFF